MCNKCGRACPIAFGRAESPDGRARMWLMCLFCLSEWVEFEPLEVVPDA